jgi:hypothetical protein
MSKHKTNIDKNTAFTFDKPSSTNPPEFTSIEKPKEVIKKTKLLNKNTEILEFFFDQKIDNSKSNNNNNNNNNNNSQDIFDPKNMKYSTPIKILPKIITSDSQTIVPSSTLFSHLSLYVPSLSSPIIQSLVVDSNTST